MNKKFTILVSVLLLLAIGLSACAPAATPQATTAPQQPQPTTAPQQPQPTKVPEQVQPTTAPAEPTTAPVEPTKPAEAAKITASYMASGTYDKAAEELAAEMKAKGLDVTIAAFPWAVLRQNNTNQLLAGTGEYDAMSGGYYLADVYKDMEVLDPYIKKDNIGQGMIEGIMSKAEFLDGKQIGIPYGIDAYGVLYRTDLFKDAGIDPATIKTWPDLLTALNTLKGKLPAGVAPYVFAYGAGEQLPGIFFGDYGGSFINKDGKFQLETDKAVNAIKLMKDMLPDAAEKSLASTIDEANAVFLDGKAAVLIGWPSFVRAAADDPTKSQVAGKWAQMEFPGPGFPWLSLWNIFMNASSKNKDAAWEWIKAYTGQDASTKFLKEYGIGSVYTATYQDPDVVAKHGHDLPVAMKNFARALNPALSGEAQDFLAATLGEVVTGQTSAEDAVKKVNDKWATLTVPAAILEMGQRTGQVAK